MVKYFWRAAGTSEIITGTGAVGEDTTTGAKSGTAPGAALEDAAVGLDLLRPFLGDFFFLAFFSLGDLRFFFCLGPDANAEENAEPTRASASPAQAPVRGQTAAAAADTPNEAG